MADSISNTGKLEPTFYCRFHNNETYQLFCKDCHDFVCFECIEAFHEKHHLCRLQDAEEDIRNQIGILFSENDNCITKFEEFIDIIDKYRRQLSKDEGMIEHQVRTNAEQLEEQISVHEKYLLLELHTKFNSFQLSSQELTTRVTNLRSDVTKFDVDKLPEYKLEEMINVLFELKACTVACDKMKNYQKPHFNTDVKYGNEMTEVEISESKNSSTKMHISVSTQTKDPDDSDTEDEWFEAEDGADEDSIERSSDEIKDDNPLHIFKLNKEITRIKKICPISHTDAWILADRQLLKLVHNSLEETKYADDADDIVVLKDGCVLILRNKSTIIMKLLKNRRLVRFANVGSSSLLPCCFCNSIDDSLTVYLCSKSSDRYGKYDSCVVQMNKEGIVTRQFHRYTYVLEKPYRIQYFKSTLCVVYLRDTIRSLHCVNLLKITEHNYYKLTKDFNGILGYNPTEHFECHGICTNNKKIFVSDIRHHSVYALDKDLKYKKCVADASDGLDKPTAIAIYSGYLWIADGDQIFILHLNNTKNNELKRIRYTALGMLWTWIKDLMSNLFGIEE